MLLLLRELKADEQRSLKLFAKAEDEGAIFPPACMFAASLPACPSIWPPCLPMATCLLAMSAVACWGCCAHVHTLCRPADPPCPGCNAGEYASMRLYHSQWKNRTEKMQLLVDDPRKFVEEHGYLYDLETTAERSARWDRECTAAGLKAVAWTVSVFLLVYSLTYLIVSVL